MSKHCAKCDTTKPQTEFGKNKGRRDGLSVYCAPCFSAYAKWYKAIGTKIRKPKLSQEELNRRSKDSKLMKNYGIDLKEFEVMEKAQNKLCLICNRTNGEHKSLNVDHCHKTGKIRGLLCDLCNRGLGLFRDNPDLLIKAIDYLKKES